MAMHGTKCGSTLHCKGLNFSKNRFFSIHSLISEPLRTNKQRVHIRFESSQTLIKHILLFWDRTGNRGFRFSKSRRPVSTHTGPVVNKQGGRPFPDLLLFFLLSCRDRVRRTNWVQDLDRLGPKLQSHSIERVSIALDRLNLCSFMYYGRLTGMKLFLFLTPDSMSMLLILQTT